MIYPCSTIHTPKWVIADFKEKILKFIWNGKPAKVKFSAIINENYNGGLKLQDLETKIKSLQNCVYNKTKMICIFVYNL